MINFLKGNIVKIEEDYIVLENNAIGYRIFTSHVTISDFTGIEDDETVLIYTEMVVREDDISLFGFSTEKELMLFNFLRTVSRVGAKSAIKMLSTMHFIDLINIIKTNDVKSLTKAKGVGTKTAKRIIIDLSEKLEEAFPRIQNNKNKVKDERIQINEDALDALIALGYSKKESESALSSFDNSSMTIEEIIKTALNYF
ncbi:MAG TPA: Holliday junction branch migration protein RuvA [Clostridia bacterium]|nr:Holliday junction branch migration protein RuvA [Clostridia bacterium]